ncbi:MAG: FAD-dependent monooxygenase [Azospirillaceae bacterium]
MRLAIVGGGPSGLFLAYLVKSRHAGSEVTVYEQNPPGATFGFGVVFSDRALPYLEQADAQAFAAIEAAMEQWDDITIARGDEKVPIDGNGFTGIARLTLLEILEDLCRRTGVVIHHKRRIDDLDALAGSVDLMVGADGIGSGVRDHWRDAFAPSIDYLTNRFAWYGTAKPFDTLTLTFRDHDGGAYVAHHYRYQPDLSTFIVECDARTWETSGLAALDEQAAARLCERVFANDLDGHPLLLNRSIWRRFPVVTNANWHHRNVVLIGDALRSVHFSIGSGTRLALEDATALAAALDDCDLDVPRALVRFEETRRPVVDKMLAAAANSYLWYEDFGDRMHLDAWDLAWSYMTRSGRVTEARLAETAPHFVGRYKARRAASG